MAPLSASQAKTAALERRTSRSVTLIHLLILTVFALLICAPVIRYGIPDLGNDSMDHARWAKQFSTQFWNGEWYPHWLANTNAGMGAPALFFYPSTAYYVAAMFWPWTHNSDPAGLYIIGLSLVISVIAAAISSYFWFRAMADPPSAIFGALIYTLIPYHMAVNFYTRTAASELWATVWIPLILLSVYRLTEGRAWALPALSVSYGLLVFTHLPTTLTFSLVPIAAALFWSEPGQYFRNFLKTGIGMAIGIGLAAPFFFPAMLQQNNAYMDLLDPFFDYRKWWLFGMHPLFDSRTRIMLMTLASVAFFGAVYIVVKKTNPTGRLRRLFIFQTIAAIAFFFMTTQLSAPIWLVVKPLAILPFPTRFLTGFDLMVAGLAAMAFRPLCERSSRLLAVTAGFFVFTWLAATLWAMPMSFARFRPIPADKVQFYKDHAAYQQDEIKYQRDYSLFWPKWTQRDKVFDFPGFADYVAKNPPRAISSVAADTGMQSGSVVVESWQPRRVVLRVEEPSKAHVRINHFYYPGWKGEIEESKTPISIQPSKPDGFWEMNVPAGKYRMEVRLERLWSEQAGLIAFYVSLLLTAALFVWSGWWQLQHNRT